MKFKSLLMVAIVAMAIEVSAQETPAPDTNPPPSSIISGPGVDAWHFLTSGSNWIVVPFGIASTEGKYGGGIAAAFKLSDYVVPFLRLDYWDGSVWMPSGNLQLQAPVRLFDTLTVVPFAFAGAATPLAGRGTDNGALTGIIGIGGAVRIGTHFDVVADIEKWTSFKGEQIRFGIGWKPKGW